MKRIEKYRWRVRWGDKWIRTRFHLTEQDALAMDPQAQRVEGSRMVIEPLDEASPHYISVGGRGDNRDA